MNASVDAFRWAAALLGIGLLAALLLIARADMKHHDIPAPGEM